MEQKEMVLYLIRVIVVAFIASVVGIFILLIAENFDHLNAAVPTYTRILQGDQLAIKSVLSFLIRLFIVSMLGLIFFYYLPFIRVLLNTVSRNCQFCQAILLSLVLAFLFNLVKPLPIYSGSLTMAQETGLLNIYFLHNVMYIFLPAFISTLIAILLHGRWIKRR